MGTMTFDAAEALAQVQRPDGGPAGDSTRGAGPTFRLVVGYWRRAVRRAVRDSSSWLRLTTQGVRIGWLGAVVAVGLGGVFAGSGGALSKASAALLAAGVSLAVFLGTFLLNLLAAPARMEAEQHGAVRDGAWELREPMPGNGDAARAPEPCLADRDDPDRQDQLERLHLAIESGEVLLAWFVGAADAQALWPGR
jgi:hypothetical protein